MTSKADEPPIDVKELRDDERTLDRSPRDDTGDPVVDALRKIWR